jgi:hypothetical protein
LMTDSRISPYRKTFNRSAVLILALSGIDLQWKGAFLLFSSWSSLAGMESAYRTVTQSGVLRRQPKI